MKTATGIKIDNRIAIKQAHVSVKGYTLIRFLFGVPKMIMVTWSNDIFN